MSENTRPYVNAELVRDVEFIEANSPDVLVDLGLLMHVMVKRRWYGDYEGWTDTPGTWLAESSRMGYRRVKAALDRLESWGILFAMSTNGTLGKGFALNYRYDFTRIRADKEGAYTEVWVVDRDAWELVPTKVSPRDALEFPTCVECGRVYHPTEGMSPDEGVCFECSLYALMRKYVEKGKDLSVDCMYGENAWTVEEMKEIFQKSNRTAGKE
jgi:hypothetical protein